jgi:hypothetical protein
MVAQKVFEIFEFCRIEKIPFVCYVFNEAEGKAPNIKGKAGGYKLTRFFLSKNSVKEYEALIKSAEGGTPLSSSLVGMFTVMENVRNIHKDKKLSLIVMTDGGCTEEGSSYRNYRHEKYMVSFPFEKSTRQSYDASGPLYKMMRDIYDCNIISINLSNHNEGLNYYENYGGANAHFDVSIERIKNPENPENKLLIDTVMEILV